MYNLENHNQNSGHLFRTFVGWTNFSQVKNGLILFVTVLGQYVLLKGLVNSGAVLIDGSLMKFLFWVCVIFTSIIGIQLSMRSILISIISWIAAIGLYLFGLFNPSLVALGACFGSLALYYFGSIFFKN